MRSLTTSVRASILKIAPTWLTPDGRVAWESLRGAFVAFWLRHGEAHLGSSPYNEAAPHVVLMAFLQRVVNAPARRRDDP